VKLLLACKILPIIPETFNIERNNLESWRRFVYAASGWLQVTYLCIVAVVTMIDAIATVTFRWKEYGEMTHSQSDATSVIFFLCKSRSDAKPFSLRWLSLNILHKDIFCDKNGVTDPAKFDL